MKRFFEVNRLSARPREAMLALGGIALLLDPVTQGVGKGEAWILTCALAVAVQVRLLQKAIRARLAILPLTLFQILGVALPAFAVALPAGSPPPGAGSWSQ